MKLDDVRAIYTEAMHHIPKTDPKKGDIVMVSQEIFCIVMFNVSSFCVFIWWVSILSPSIKPQSGNSNIKQKH